MERKQSNTETARGFLANGLIDGSTIWTGNLIRTNYNTEISEAESTDTRVELQRSPTANRSLGTS